MQLSQPGIGSYYREYFFYRTVNEAAKKLDYKLTTTQVRSLRDKFTEHVASYNNRVIESNLSVSPEFVTAIGSLSRSTDTKAYNAVVSRINSQAGNKDLALQLDMDNIPVTGALLPWMDTVLSNELPGYVPMYKRDTSGYVEPWFATFDGDFKNLIAFNEPEVENAALPISPYDPRWSYREVVIRSGNDLTYLPEEQFRQRGGIDLIIAPEIKDKEFQLYSQAGDEDGIAYYPIGQSLRGKDELEFNRLSPYMTKDEYQQVFGKLSNDVFKMGDSVDVGAVKESLKKAEWILEYLQESGLDYRLTSNREGQVQAFVEGTRLDIRLIDLAQPRWAGRVYDNGVTVRYSILDNQRGAPRFYNPSTKAEVTDIIRFALGEKVATATKPDVGLNRPVTITKGNSKTTIANAGYPTKKFGTEIRPDAGKRSFRALYGVGRDDNGRLAVLALQKDAQNRSNPYEFFAGSEQAQAFLENSIASAKENFANQVNLPWLFLEAEKLHEDPTYTPEFLGDLEVVAIQRQYWDILNGTNEALLRPSVSEEMFFMEVELAPSEDLRNIRIAELAYTGSPREIIERSFYDQQNYLIGSLAPDASRVDLGNNRSWETKRFDPIRVARYMTAQNSELSNISDIASALRVYEEDGQQIEVSELLGDDAQLNSFKDRLITFGAEPVINAADFDNLTTQGRLVQVVLDSLANNGIKDVEALVDSRGVVSWTGKKTSPDKLEDAPIQGVIGQIFEVGEYGEIVTKFVGRDNYLMAPGYEAWVQSQKIGENKTLEERTRLRGFEEMMTRRIQKQVADDVLVQTTSIGEASSLNSAYRSLYEERFDVDFINKADERGFGKDLAIATLQTLTKKVRYGDEMRDTFYEDYIANLNGESSLILNDNFSSAYVLSGGRNMAVIADSSKGYFDPVMTNASKMGTTFYLVEGAEVDSETGAIIRSEDLDDRSTLMKHPHLRFSEFDAWDRQQNASSVIAKANRIVENTSVVFTDKLKGWTLDDGVVISRDYAEANTIVGSDGQMRALMIGDKVSDLHGNKGVIGLVVDRQMDIEVAEDEGLDYAVRTFQMNPELDIVMSPFSGVSRYNAGSAREVMSGPVRDTHFPNYQDDPSLVEDIDQRPALIEASSQGQVTLVITNKDVESGTRYYDEDALMQGKGRRASGQLSWVLGAKNAKELMQDFYGMNTAGTANLREYLVLLGLDFDAVGKLSPTRLDVTNEQRQEISLRLPLNGNGSVPHRKEIDRAFASVLNTMGGDLLVPFPLQTASGSELVKSETREYVVSRHGRVNGEEIVVEGLAEHDFYRLPLLSSHLRAGQENVDGSFIVHDYTKQYQAIYHESLKYLNAASALASGGLDSKKASELAKQMKHSVERSQQAYSRIASDVIEKRIENKSNVFRNEIMSNRLPNSATAVWAPNPTLDIDEVGIGVELAAGLGVKTGQRIMFWRDPILREGGVRSLKVRVLEDLVGVSINPAIAKSFDGDFDGDSVGIVVPTSKAARREAERLFSLEANLLDFGETVEIEVAGQTHMVYPLFLNDSLDIKVSQHFNPELKETYAALTLEANRVYEDYKDRHINESEYAIYSRDVIDKLSDFYREAYSPKAGGVVLSFADTQSHLDSVGFACVETGAKGNAAKLADYGIHLGVKDGKDFGETLHTRKQDQGVMVAVTVKTMVGIAGTYSQRAIKVGRDDIPSVVLELTHPVTQALLQAKHDPKEAMDRYAAIMGPGRDLWRGFEMNYNDEKEQWQVVRDKKGDPVPANTEAWVKTFVEMYNHPKGFNVSVNEEHVRKLAAFLHDPESNTVRNIEDGNIARGNLLDKLAYGGDFEMLKEAAKEQAELFAGNQGKAFAPNSLKRNQMEPLFAKPLTKSDVEKDGRVKAKVSGSVRGVKTGLIPDFRIKSELASVGTNSVKQSQNFEMEL